MEHHTDHQDHQHRRRMKAIFQAPIQRKPPGNPDIGKPPEITNARPRATFIIPSLATFRRKNEGLSR